MLVTPTDLSHCGPQYYNFMSLHYGGPIIPNCHNPQYKVAKFNGMTFKVGTFADSYCSLSCGAIVCIKNVTYSANIPVIDREFLIKKEVLNILCSFSLLHIYSVYSLSDLKSWPLKNIVKKNVKLPIESDKFAVFLLLHFNM